MSLLSPVVMTWDELALVQTGCERWFSWPQKPVVLVWEGALVQKDDWTLNADMRWVKD